MVRCTDLKIITICFYILYICVAIYVPSKHNQNSKFSPCKLVKLVKMESLSLFTFVCLWFSDIFLNFSVTFWSLCFICLHSTVLCGCTAIGFPFLQRMDICFVSISALWVPLLGPFLYECFLRHHMYSNLLLVYLRVELFFIE